MLKPKMANAIVERLPYNILIVEDPKVRAKWYKFLIHVAHQSMVLGNFEGTFTICSILSKTYTTIMKDEKMCQQTGRKQK